MRFLAVALLAICLLHGSSATPQPQFAEFGNLVNNAFSTVSHAASGAISAASNAFQTAASKVSSAVQNMFDLAPKVSVDQLTELAKKLSPKEMLETINHAEAQIQSEVNAAVDVLADIVDNVDIHAERAIQSATADLNPEVKSVIDKALEAGVDINDCAAETALSLGKSAITDVVKCGTDKLKKAVELAQSIADLVPRAKELSQEGSAGFQACNAQSNILIKGKCHVDNIVPIAVNSTLLVKDTVSYAAKVVKLVTTLQTSLQTCAATVAAKKALEAASASAKVAKCVSGKLAA